jgi:hypothetical protein
MIASNENKSEEEYIKMGDDKEGNSYWTVWWE